ncbi:Tn3 family transposase [Escherichia coli]
MFYTHISDQYAPFSTRVVNVGVRDSTYVLDGLLYHESDLRIEGALHRHGRLHRSRLCPDAPARLPLRAAHPRPRRNQAVRAAGRAKPTRRCAR